MNKRFESKYLVDRQKSLQLLQSLVKQKMLLTDPYGERNTGKYTIESLYFDTPDNDCLMDSIEGYPVRRKIRVRHYRDESYHIVTADSLELKTKNLHHVHKVRSPYQHTSSTIVKCFHFNDVTVPGPWIPMAVIEYERFAFYLPSTDNIRITLDIDVRSKTPHDFSGPHRGLIFLNPDVAILEIKGSTDASIRSFHDFFRRYVPAQPTRFSKYCLGVLSMNPYLSEEYWASYYNYLSKDVFFVNARQLPHNYNTRT